MFSSALLSLFVNTITQKLLNWISENSVEDDDTWATEETVRFSGNPDHFMFGFGRFGLRWGRSRDRPAKHSAWVIMCYQCVIYVHVLSMCYQCACVIWRLLIVTVLQHHQPWPHLNQHFYTRHFNYLSEINMVAINFNFLYGTIQPICAESAIKPQPTNQPTISLVKAMCSTECHFCFIACYSQ